MTDRRYTAQDMHDWPMAYRAAGKQLAALDAAIRTVLGVVDQLRASDLDDETGSLRDAVENMQFRIEQIEGEQGRADEMIRRGPHADPLRAA